MEMNEEQKNLCLAEIRRLGRLVHKKTIFRECERLLRFHEGIDYEMLDKVFTDNRFAILWDDGKADHLKQIPNLPENNQQVALVFDAGFMNVLMRREGALWTLPALQMSGRSAKMTSVQGPILNKFSAVSFRDDTVGEVTVRAFYFLNAEWLPNSSRYSWRPFVRAILTAGDITAEAKGVLNAFSAEYMPLHE